MRPTHSVEADLLYSESPGLNVNVSQKISSQKPLEWVDQIFGLCVSAKLTRKLSHRANQCPHVPQPRGRMQVTCELARRV